MFEFLLAPENTPFTLALSVMIVISILELLGAIVGIGFSHTLDRLFVNAEWDYELDQPCPSALGPIAKVINWFSFRGIPTLVILIIFFMIFGFTGLLIQDIVQGVFGFLLPGLLAVFFALMATFPMMRGAIVLFTKIIPKDESSALSRDSFVGKIAEITLGTAKKGYSAQGKMKDRFGQVHYLMIEPDNQDEVFYKGDFVLLVKHDRIRFFAIKIKNEELIKS